MYNNVNTAVINKFKKDLLKLTSSKEKNKIAKLFADEEFMLELSNSIFLGLDSSFVRMDKEIEKYNIKFK